MAVVAAAPSHADCSFKFCKPFDLFNGLLARLLALCSLQSTTSCMCMIISRLESPMRQVCEVDNFDLSVLRKKGQVPRSREKTDVSNRVISINRKLSGTVTCAIERNALSGYSSSSMIPPKLLLAIIRRMMVVLGGSLNTVGTGSSSRNSVVTSIGFEARTNSF